MTSAQTPAPRLFAASPWLIRAAQAILFAAGLLVRLYDLHDAPLDFHGTRQLHSALIARGMYYQTLADAPAWQREMADAQRRAEGLIEPQIMETLAAFGYRLAGSERLWIPRLLSILFWLAGGVGVFLIGRDLTDANGGIAAAAFYIALHYGVIASRSFQPDPLLTAAIVWALWAIFRWQRQPTWGRTVAAGLLGGLAIYVKSTAVFFIAGAWLGLILFGIGLGKALRDPRIWLAGALTVLPYAAYHIYATAVLHLLESQFSLRFFPQMWIDPVFYLRWKNLIEGVMDLSWLLVALAGVFLIRDKAARSLFAGAFAGYFIYGVIFSYQTSTHDYYHLPLIPLVGLGLGAAFALAVSSFHGPRWLRSALAVVLLLAFAASNLWDARVELKRADYRAEAALAEEIGAIFRPQDRVVSIAPYYSYALSYWGWVNATNWFSAGDFEMRALAGQGVDVRAAFNEATEGKDYFLVMDFVELDRQPLVKELLERHYPLIQKTDQYALYDLRKPLGDQ
jgi:hypothetical protein